MLVSLAIIGTLSGVVIAKYSDFDSTVLLKAAAYEVGSSIREAQVYSVSVIGTESGPTGFSAPYGLTFEYLAKNYQFFKYTGSSFPEYTTGNYQNINNPIRFEKNVEISDICVNTTGANTYCTSSYPSNISRVDISFKRPEFKALFHVHNPITPQIENPTTLSDGNIESVEVRIRSPRDPSKEYSIVVGILGHISVQKP